MATTTPLHCLWKLGWLALWKFWFNEGCGRRLFFNYLLLSTSCRLIVASPALHHGNCDALRACGKVLEPHLNSFLPHAWFLICKFFPLCGADDNSKKTVGKFQFLGALQILTKLVLQSKNRVRRWNKFRRDLCESRTRYCTNKSMRADESSWNFRDLWSLWQCE